jgi:ATP/maltotriose-dependent transcriptional regulator MalT
VYLREKVTVAMIALPIHSRKDTRRSEAGKILVGLHLRPSGAAVRRCQGLNQLTSLKNTDSNVYTCIARNLGEAAALCGDQVAARAYYVQALESGRKIRFRPEIALTHLRFAESLLSQANDNSRAEALEHLGLAIPELLDMHMQTAVDRAQALNGSHRAFSQPAPPRASGPDTLTPRELEIIGLIADGLSNLEIAHKLVITHATVEVHVKHILSKLGFRSRGQAAVWFVHQQSGTSQRSV